MPYTAYDITYSTGTNLHDERRYLSRNIPAAELSDKIARLQAKGHSIYSVEVAFIN